MAKNHQVIGGGRWVKRSLFLVGEHWTGRVRDTHSGRVHKVATRERVKAKAERMIVKWIEAQEQRESQVVAPAGVGLEAALKEWIGLKDVRDVTRDAYLQDVNLYVNAFPGKLVHEIDVGDVEKFLKSLTNNGKSARTRSKHLVALRGFFRWCIRRKYRADNPAEGLKVGRGTKAVKIAFTPEQMTKLLKACQEKRIVEVNGTNRGSKWKQEYPVPEYLAVAGAIAYYTGLRRSNIFGLRWKHVDLGGKKIALPGEMMKNHAAHDVPIHPDLGAMLDRLAKSKGKLDPQGFVVGAEVLVATKGLQSACVRAGLPPIGWHTLRHSFASILAASPTCSFNSLRELLGHKPQSVTDIYVHSTWADRVSAIESLPSISTVLQATACELGAS